MDGAIKVLPHGIGMAVARQGLAGGEMDAELAVVELGAVAEVGAGDQQFVVGHAALHGKHGGAQPTALQGGGDELIDAIGQRHQTAEGAF